MYTQTNTSDYFDGAPVIRVPGRMYNVDIQYIPPAITSSHSGSYNSTANQQQQQQQQQQRQLQKRFKFDTKPYCKLLAHIDATVPNTERGDLLVFLSGLSDMLLVQDALKQYIDKQQAAAVAVATLDSNISSSSCHWIVLLLHSTLSADEQDKAFAQVPIGTRKCILATNIAESAITIEGVRFVADSGRCKEMGFDVTTGETPIM
jgi:ATP-dependent RNA helicase DHX34